jgi:phosphatidylinositol alpha-1,6-mannosyltransferase
MVGGAEIVLLEVYRRLAERHEVCLLTADKDLPPSDLDHLINFPVIRYQDRLSFMNFRGHRLTGGIVPPFSFSAVSAMREAINDFRPDVLNTHYVAHTGLATVIAQKKYGLPTVLSFTGRDVPGPRTPWFWKYYDRWVAGSVAEVTFISPYCRRAIYGSESILGTVISSGVDLERFSPRISGSHIRQRLNLSQETPVLFAVQRLSSEKRVDIVIRAMPHVLDKHPDVVLVIGGKGPDRSNLDSLLQELGLEQSIYFAGYIPNSDLPAYYAMADIFVFHSTYETFGIVIAEAMAGGKPVVSVRSTAISDVVQDGQTGLLAVPMSPIDMADKIIHLLNSPSKFQQFGQNGRLWAEQHFDWNVIVEQYEKILLKAAKS